MGSSPPAAAAPRRDTASCQGSTARMPRCACCGASLDAGSSSARLADLCLCADAPRAVAVCVAGRRRAVSWSARQQDQEPSLRLRTDLPRALHTLPHTQCSRATRSRAHRAALSSTSARRDDSLSSHDLPEPAQRRTPARISQSDHASSSPESSDAQPETVPTRWSVAASRAFCPSLSLPHSAVLLV